MAILICRTDERNDIGIHGVSSAELNWLSKHLNLKINEVGNDRFVNFELDKVTVYFFHKQGDK